MKPLSLVLAILAVVVCLATNVTAQTWNLSLVDNAGDAGYQSRIAVASDGTPYILHGAATTLRLAWWVASDDTIGGWNNTTVSGDYNYTGYYRNTSIRVDPYDKLHIAWETKNGPNRLWYAIFDAATKSWDLPPSLLLTASTTFGPDLAVFDEGGLVRVTMAYTYGSALKYATRDPATGTWSYGTICDKSGVGHQVSIAVDSAGRLHVSFFEESDDDLMYATKAPTDNFWTCSYVDLTASVGRHSSIIVDDSDVPCIAYYDETNGDLKYARLLTP